MGLWDDETQEGMARDHWGGVRRGLGVTPGVTTASQGDWTDTDFMHIISRRTNCLHAYN